MQKDFTIRVDEPLELCGTNQFPNPQEYLLAALNACMIVGYVAACALEGITLQELRIETSGDIDLRGFLGLDPAGEARLRRAPATPCTSSPTATPAQIERDARHRLPHLAEPLQPLPADPPATRVWSPS